MRVPAQESLRLLFERLYHRLSDVRFELLPLNEFLMGLNAWKSHGDSSGVCGGCLNNWLMESSVLLTLGAKWDARFVSAL
jgi:hypothetical protein